jgi:hypothetical protein
MAVYSDRAAAIERLRNFPDELEARVAPLNDDDLDRHAPGEWSTRQIVHHLADSHMSANFRLRKPLSEPNPAPLPVYDQAAWAEMADSRLPVAPSLLILHGLHARFVALLESLTDAQWMQTGSHPEWGIVTVENVAYRYAAHCDIHLAQIERALRGLP